MFDRCIIISVYMYISRNDWKQCDSLFGWINCKWECKNPKTLHKEYFGPGQNLTTSKFERHILQLVLTFKNSAPKKNAYVHTIYIYIWNICTTHLYLALRKGNGGEAFVWRTISQFCCWLEPNWTWTNHENDWHTVRHMAETASV